MAISVSDLYSSLGSGTIAPGTIASTSNAEHLTSQIENAQTDLQAKEACEQFEAYLIQQMFKSMEESTKALTSDDEESDSDDYVDMFSDNMYQEIAENMVANGGGLGIAKMLYESMERNGQIEGSKEL
ncbi:rod-binding protein [Eubacterium xylanophilum]|uniref:rod-binding protein n=1 Tax=Eubacterium xylanophilum TaxID=39497 RepID=UPI00047CAC95|nr:rod-binding protein [Eubacterium xylanophilum]MCR5797025.1 rod-binding protein [Eubacterium sp.]